MHDQPLHNATTLMDAAAKGDAHAAAALLPLVYDELRALARARLSHEKPGQTLQATALVHDAYMRLVGGEGGDPKWSGRNHFFSAAAIAMRRILIERARAYAGPKRGGGRERVELHESAALTGSGDPEMMDWEALDAALQELEQEDERLARVVNLRYFAGLSFDAVAELLGISSRTAKRDWEYAKAWLYERLANPGASE